VSNGPQVAPAATETVIRKRTLTAAEAAPLPTGNAMPDFWEYIESLTPSQWSDHVVYVYREDPKDSNYSSEPSYVDKFAGSIEISPGVIVPTFERESIEYAIKEKHGGKAFRLICKKGPSRVAIGKCVNGAPPKYPEFNTRAHPLPNANGNNSDNIAVKAMDTIANQNPALINIAIDAVSRAADIVARAQQPPVHPAPSTDSELDRAFKQAMIQKLLAPPPDPIDTFLKLKQVLGDNGSSGGGQNALVDKLLNAAVDRFMNPASAAPPITGRTTLLDLGREFIPVLGTVMHEYRLSREADARMAEVARSMPPQPAQNPAPLPVNITAQPAAAPAQSAPQPTAPAAAAPQAPTLTFPQIEAHIAKIIANAEYPIEEAVDRVLSFLYDTDGRLVPALLNPPSIDARLKPGKEGLMQLFTYEPALQPCTVNLPRLSEFLDKFIAEATLAEENEARLRAAAPAAVAPAATPAPAPAS
jgi:hypothetical protein